MKLETFIIEQTVFWQKNHTKRSVANNKTVYLYFWLFWGFLKHLSYFRRRFETQNFSLNPIHKIFMLFHALIFSNKFLFSLFLPFKNISIFFCVYSMRIIHERLELHSAVYTWHIKVHGKAVWTSRTGKLTFADVLESKPECFQLPTHLVWHTAKRRK